MANFTLVDNIILGIFAISAIFGLFRGGIREAVSFGAWIAGFLVASVFARPLSGMLAKTAWIQHVTGAVSQNLAVNSTPQVSLALYGGSFIVLLFLTVFAGSVIGALLTHALESTGISFFNRAFGLLLGLARGYLINLLIVFMVQMMPLSEASAWTHSRLVPGFAPGINALSGMMGPELKKLKSRLGSEVPLEEEQGSSFFTRTESDA